MLCCTDASASSSRASNHSSTKPPAEHQPSNYTGMLQIKASTNSACISAPGRFLIEGPVRSKRGFATSKISHKS